MDELTIVLIFWSIAWIFSAIQDRIQFRFSESPFAYIKNEKVRKWFAGEMTRDLKNRFPVLPMIWDGWHSAKWFKWFMLYLGFCQFYLNAAILFALTGIITFNGFYHLVLKRPKKPA